MEKVNLEYFLNNEINELFNNCGFIKVYLNNKNNEIGTIRNITELEILIKELDIKLTGIRIFGGCGLILND